MSREIKFRAKVADNDYENEKQSEMIGSFVHFTGFIDLENDIGYVEQFEKINGVGWIDVDLKTLGQYTGLKDKNGKEIYEGDIIYWEINNGVGIESYTAVVKWSENLVKEGWNQTYKWLVGYTGNYYRGSYDELSTPAAYNDALQIIGNIYENPELLEETA